MLQQPEGATAPTTKPVSAEVDFDFDDMHTAMKFHEQRTLLVRYFPNEMPEQKENLPS